MLALLTNGSARASSCELFLSNFGQKHALVRKVAARMEIRAPAADHGYKRPPI
jgi:hypothetical protein